MQFVFKSTYQVHHSLLWIFSSVGGGGWVCRETEEGGARDPERSQTTDVTAIYHSESMHQQLCARSIEDRLLLLLLHPLLPLSHFSVQSCMGTLCVYT